MKKLFILAMAAAMVSCGGGTKYSISGTSEDFTDGKWAFLGVQQGRELIKSDSVQIAGNSFTLKGEVENPYAAYIVIGDLEARPEMYINIMVEPGKIQIEKPNADDPFLAKGTPLNDKLADMLYKMKELNQNKGSEEDFIAIQKSTISENIDNALGLKIFKESYYYFEPQEVIDFVNAMPEATQADESIAKTKQMAEQALKVTAGNPYIDIVEKDADGKDITLKSVVEDKNNKFILIDFWASWCGPCMVEVPHLKEAYNLYHKKGFEIYAVSLDRDRDSWLKAIESKEMNWIHVSAVKYWDSQARNDYAVTSIPSNYLIDCSTGKIIATQLRGKALIEKLGELLK